MGSHKKKELYERIRVCLPAGAFRFLKIIYGPILPSSTGHLWPRWFFSRLNVSIGAQVALASNFQADRFSRSFPLPINASSAMKANSFFFVWYRLSDNCGTHPGRIHTLRNITRSVGAFALVRPYLYCAWSTAISWCSNAVILKAVCFFCFFYLRSLSVLIFIIISGNRWLGFYQEERRSDGKPQLSRKGGDMFFLLTAPRFLCAD